MEDTLYYSINAGSTQRYFNIAKDLAKLNSKNEEITTRDGHVYGYLVNVSASIGATNSMLAFAAPNSWKMRNSFRKFHAYRNLMFDNAGIEGEEKGKYGKTMRVYLDQEHVVASDVQMVTVDSQGNSITYDGGEWTYTQLATTPIYGAGPRPGTENNQWADLFPLHICEENQFSIPGDDSNSGMYDSVGMIHSYNLDRMEVVTPTGAEVLESPSNPLAALKATGNQATGAVLDIAIDQELEAPPYDIADNGDSIYAPLNAFKVSASTAGTISFQMFVPAGVMRTELTVDTSYPITVQVLGKVLCKDLA